jgi:hypothetical protein
MSLLHKQQFKMHSTDVNGRIEGVKRLEDVQDFARRQYALSNHVESGGPSILIQFTLEFETAATVEYLKFDGDKVVLLCPRILNKQVEVDKLLAVAPLDKGSIRSPDDLDS